MNNDLPIAKSSVPLTVQMIVIAVIGSALFLLVSRILRAIGDFVSFDASSLGNLVRLLVLLLVVLAILSAYANAKKIKYSISTTAITVTVGSYVGQKQKHIHSIAAFTSIVLDQSPLGARYNYGNIVLNMDRLGSSEKIILKNIDNPDVVIKDIRSKITSINKK